MARLPAAALALAVVVGLLTVGSTAIASDTPNRIHYYMTGLAIDPPPINPATGNEKQPDGCMDKRKGFPVEGGTVFTGWADHEFYFGSLILHLVYVQFNSKTATLAFLTPQNHDQFGTPELPHGGIVVTAGSNADPDEFKLRGLAPKTEVPIFRQQKKGQKVPIGTIDITADPVFTKVATCDPGGQHP